MEGSHYETKKREDCDSVIEYCDTGIMGKHFKLGRTAGYGRVEVIEAPEQTESMLHPYFVKEVYEPVIPTGTNIAQDAKITASGFQDVYTPRKAADGKTEGNSYWEGENDA